MLVEARLLFGAATVVIATYALGLSLPRTRRLWLDAAIMALMSNVVPFALIAWAETHIASGTLGAEPACAVHRHAAPFFITEVAAKAAGVLTGFVGVAVFSGRPHRWLNALGDLACCCRRLLRDWGRSLPACA
jgi:hypothetical protein